MAVGSKAIRIGFETRWIVKQASVCNGTLVRRHAPVLTVEGAISAPASA